MNISNNLVTFKLNGWAVPAGWKLVPEEPTEDMLAATSWPECAKTDYQHMLRAAPQPPQKARVVIGYVPISAIEETPLDGYVPVYAPERKDGP